MVQVTRRAKRVPILANQPYETEMQSPGLISAMPFRASGRFATTAANGTVGMDSMFGFLGSLEIERNGEPIVRVLGPDLRHLTAAFADYHELHPSLTVLDTTALTPAYQKALGAGKLNFEAPFRGGNNAPCLIDARNGKLVIRGQARSLAYIASTIDATDYEFYLDAYAHQAPARLLSQTGGLFYEPRWSYSIEALSTSTTIEHARHFAEGQILCGVQIRQLDASLEFTNANVGRSDTLVKAVRIEHRPANRPPVEILPWTSWQDIKSRMHEEMGLPSVRSGVAIVLFDDPTTPEVETLVVGAGDDLVIQYDTASTVDKMFDAYEPGAAPSDATVAAGDQAIVTWLGYVAPGHQVRVNRA